MSTPGPTFTRGNPPRWVLDCGCEVGALHVVHCPLHAAASEMRDALRFLLDSRIEADCYPDSMGVCMVHHADHREEADQQARALLAKIETQ